MCSQILERVTLSSSICTPNAGIEVSIFIDVIITIVVVAAVVVRFHLYVSKDQSKWVKEECFNVRVKNSTRTTSPDSCCFLI